MCCPASWKALYIETLQELQVLSLMKQINKEIILANVCIRYKLFVVICHTLQNNMAEKKHTNCSAHSTEHCDS